jgi:hypothetical protein
VTPGPHLDVTGPFMTGPGPTSLQTQILTGPEEASQTVAFWADRGVSSFKAYVDITRAELRAMVVEAHKRGLKVLGHLCSVTYEEAAEAGIDSLEHGFFVNTQLDPGKQPDKCSDSRGDYTLEHMTAEQANQLIATLVNHHVAITSTRRIRSGRPVRIDPGICRPPRNRAAGRRRVQAARGHSDCDFGHL